MKLTPEMFWGMVMVGAVIGAVLGVFLWKKYLEEK